MIHPLIMAALGTGFTFLMTTLGAAMVFFFAKEIPVRFQSAILGFAGGVMTAASVWSLLLPAIEQASSETVLPCWIAPAIGLTLGALFLSGLDLLIHAQRFSAIHAPPGFQENLLLICAITLHNIPEGMAIGLAFALSDGGNPAAAAALALGIGIQNLPEGAAISLPLRQTGSSRFQAFFYGMLSGTVEPVFGLLVVLAASRIRHLMPWLLSFAAGAMLYVVVDELVPHAQGKAGTIGYIVGFLIMMILDIALG